MNLDAEIFKKAQEWLNKNKEFELLFVEQSDLNEKFKALTQPQEMIYKTDYIDYSFVVDKIISMAPVTVNEKEKYNSHIINNSHQKIPPDPSSIHNQLQENMRCINKIENLETSKQLSNSSLTSLNPSHPQYQVFYPTFPGVNQQPTNTMMPMMYPSFFPHQFTAPQQIDPNSSYIMAGSESLKLSHNLRVEGSNKNANLSLLNQEKSPKTKNKLFALVRDEPKFFDVKLGSCDKSVSIPKNEDETPEYGNYMNLHKEISFGVNNNSIGSFFTSSK
jgi:hypothetical protein